MTTVGTKTEKTHGKEEITSTSGERAVLMNVGSELVENGVDVVSLHSQLSAVVGSKKALEFIEGFNRSITNPDTEIRQGGTSNCWFVDRMSELARNDPRRFASIISEAVLNREMQASFFEKEDGHFSTQRLGNRTLFSRVSQRWFLSRYGLDGKEGVSEQVIKDSDSFWLGKSIMIVAVNGYSTNGTRAADVLNNSDLIHRSGAVLHWIDGGHDAGYAAGQHAYHRVVMLDPSQVPGFESSGLRAGDGRVYFTEGVKTGNFTKPPGFKVHTGPDGQTIFSLPEDEFAKRAIGFYLDEKRAGTQFREDYYNKSMMFDVADLFLIPKELVDKGKRPAHTDEESKKVSHVREFEAEQAKRKRSSPF